MIGGIVLDYRRLLTDTMLSSKYKGMTCEGLKDSFNVQSSQELTAFLKALNELIDEYVIIEEKDKFYLAEKLGYFKGTLRINQKGFGFVENEEGSVYVSESNINHALDKDEVLAKSHVLSDGSCEAEIIRVIEHHLKQIVGTMKMMKGKMKFLPDSDTLREPIEILNQKSVKLVNDSKVLVKITHYAPIQGRIERVIGYKYDPGIDILSLLLEHDITPEFNDSVMKEVNKIKDHVVSADYEGREDLTNDMIITIDGEDARDLDDAVSVVKIDNGYRLGVHIADVSYYVQPGSEIDQEAYLRGTSVYVTDRVVPMLPHALSNGICSLNPKVERCTISCMMDIDATGDIVNYKIFPSIIKTTERMTYTAVNKMIEKDPKTCKKYAHLSELVENMTALSQIIRNKRHESGSIDFDTNEGKVIVNEKGIPVDVVLRTRKEAERIIEDFMVQANECVATHTRWLEIPSIYRVHEQPDVKKMREFVQIAQLLGFKFKGNVTNIRPAQCQQLLEAAKGREDYPVLSTSLLRCMAKAKYDPKCLGHFGLALNEYTHFTSPIRRYPDLIVHRYLRKYCFGSMPDSKAMSKDEKWIEKAALQCSERERNAIEAERDVDDMKKAEYMEKHIGEMYEGIVSGVTKFGVFVELENTVEGLIHVSNMEDDHYVYEETTRSLLGMATKKRYMLGQKVLVKCISASRFKKQVDFVFLKQKGKRS